MSPADPTGPRFLIEDIYPCVDGGRYPIKRIAGEAVEVWADIFREGHDVLAAALLWQAERADEWQREPMRSARQRPLARLRSRRRSPGWYLFAIEAWTDQYATWRKEFLLKREAGPGRHARRARGRELLTQQLMPTQRAARLVVEAALRKFEPPATRPSCSTDVLAAGRRADRRRAPI